VVLPEEAGIVQLEVFGLHVHMDGTVFQVTCLGRAQKISPPRRVTVFSGSSRPSEGGHFTGVQPSLHRRADKKQG
jgi:hypothetical protein